MLVPGSGPNRTDRRCGSIPSVTVGTGMRSRRPPALVQVPRGAETLLSHEQLRLWLLEELGAGALPPVDAVRLTGPLDVPALRWSLDRVVGLHDGLHTEFGVRDGIPFQVVGPHRSLDVPVFDLRDQS